MALSYRTLAATPLAFASAMQAFLAGHPLEAVMSSVSNVPAAAPGEAVQHFSAKFTFETDCWDVHQAMIQGADDFVLLDVRSPEDYRAGHVPGAISLPHGKIIGSKMTQW